MHFIASRIMVLSCFLRPASTTLLAKAPQARDWSPPQHLAPMWARLSDPVVLLVALLAHHPYIVGLSMIPVVMALGKLFPSLTQDSSRAMRRRRIISGIMITFGVANLVIGTTIANALIYWTGEAGSGTISAAHTTSSVYNNRFIVAYDIAIRTPPGRLVTSRFHDNDFIVYPSHNRTLYPGVGDQFTVRFLRLAPTEFVIVESDDSPFSQRLHSNIERMTY